MRRDYLKLKLNDPGTGSVTGGHGSDSDDESSDRSNRRPRSCAEDVKMIPVAITAQVDIKCFYPSTW
ncbi:unnamed protein product, partial [Iphiclides podalirius]